MTDEEAFEAWLSSREGRNVLAEVALDLNAVTNGPLAILQEYARQASLTGRASAAPPEPVVVAAKVEAGK